MRNEGCAQGLVIKNLKTKFDRFFFRPSGHVHSMLMGTREKSTTEMPKTKGTKTQALEGRTKGCDQEVKAGEKVMLAEEQSFST